MNTATAMRICCRPQRVSAKRASFGCCCRREQMRKYQDMEAMRYRLPPVLATGTSLAYCQTRERLWMYREARKGMRFRSSHLVSGEHRSVAAEGSRPMNT
jgi:hypothetical protein